MGEMHTHAWNRSLARSRALGRVLLFLTFFLCFDKWRSTFNQVWSENFRCDFFFLLSSGSPRKRTTSVIVTGNFKFCLRKNLCIILRSDIKRNSFLTERHLMVLFEALSALFLVYHQGHPVDLFLKISVLQANFCWLGDLGKWYVRRRKVLLGNRQIRVFEGICCLE